MAIVVVGGSGRGVGKTALVCGIVAGLPEFRWTAVKITTHAHGQAAIQEEKVAGQETDGARTLAAGAERAFLVTAGAEELGPRMAALLERLRRNDPAAHLIIESNRIVAHVRADVCLAVAAEAGSERKASFALLERNSDAAIARAARDSARNGAKPVFELADFGQISAAMRAWLRERLQAAQIAGEEGNGPA
jgi:hypothetical protein